VWREEQDQREPFLAPLSTPLPGIWYLVGRSAVKSAIKNVAAHKSPLARASDD
jgi:hypothetical protein